MSGPNPIRQMAIVLDTTEAEVQFALVAGRFEDFSPVLGGAVLTELRDMEKAHFDSEGKAFGHKFHPLAPSDSHSV